MLSVVLRMKKDEGINVRPVWRREETAVGRWEVGGFMPDWMEVYDVTDLFLRLLIVRSD